MPFLRPSTHLLEQATRPQKPPSTCQSRLMTIRMGDRRVLEFCFSAGDLGDRPPRPRLTIQGILPSMRELATWYVTMDINRFLLQTELMEKKHPRGLNTDNQNHGKRESEGGTESSHTKETFTNGHHHLTTQDPPPSESECL